MRYVLSILSVYKVLSVPVSPSLHSITDPFSGKDQSGSFIDFNEVLLSLFGDLSNIRSIFQSFIERQEFHVSMASGPNGHAV